MKDRTELTLSSETKRYLRNLTSALEKVARGMAMYMPQEPTEGTKRLSEPSVTLSPQSIQNLVEAVKPDLVTDPDKV